MQLHCMLRNRNSRNGYAGDNLFVRVDVDAFHRPA